MVTVEPVDHLVGGCGDFGKGDPRVLIGGQTLPAHEVLVALAEFARVEDGMKFLRGRVVRVERERERKREMIRAFSWPFPLFLSVLSGTVGRRRSEMREYTKTGGKEDENVNYRGMENRGCSQKAEGT